MINAVIPDDKFDPESFYKITIPGFFKENTKIIPKNSKEIQRSILTQHSTRTIFIICFLTQCQFYDLKGVFSMSKKTLVAYFSASGVTAKAAKEIAQATGADLYEIAPQTPYTSADLNWMDKKSRSSLEMADASCRPALAQPVPDMTQYNTVLVGFPVWWYVEPRIIDTFLESLDLSGKTMIPFATSGGSGIEKSVKNMQAHYPQADWKPGKLVNHGAGAWARSILD